MESERVSALLELGFEHTDPAARETMRVDRDTYRAWSARPAMGTVVSLVALHASRALAEEALEVAFGEMDRLIEIFDRHDPGTPLAQLNVAGHVADAPPELADVVGASLRYHRLTLGAFDVTVKPLVDLLRATSGRPTEAERREAAALVGASQLRLDGRRISFCRSGMGVTLDGIAKGYIVDRMGAALAKSGVRRYLIDAGGDVLAQGGKEGGRPWTIGVRDPEDPEGIREVVALSDGAIATSGNYERPFAHIVDAAAGEAAVAAASVSVSAPDAMSADALATALFALGPAAGGRLSRSLPGCASLIVDEEGRCSASAGWPGSTTEEAGEA